MENRRGVYSIIILVVFISLAYLACSKKETKADFFNDEDFHLALYTNPSSDCIACILKAIKALNANTHEEEREPIYVFVKHSDDKERFIDFLKGKFPSAAIKFFDHTLNAPTPSILLMKKEKIYMWLYIQNDPFQFDLCLKKCLQLLASFNN
jgi:hypothetical protein